MIELLREIHRRDRVLSLAGWLQVSLLAAMLMALPLDERTLLGVSVWLKPIKFSLSIAIYVWTLAWFLPYLTGPGWAKAIVRWGTVAAMTVEIVCIAGQSLRGQASHFNDATSFDGAVYSAMGLFIMASAMIDVLLLVLFFTHARPLAQSYLWGIRLGLVGVILAGGVGVMMVNRHAHTIGGPDGGPGVPIVNWSTQYGDLRAAHAMLLHALQLLPLTGYWLSRRTSLRPGQQTVVLFAVAAAYGLLSSGVMAIALAGRPLWI